MPPASGNWHSAREGIYDRLARLNPEQGFVKKAYIFDAGDTKGFVP
jgi:hypothetical protein